jgi:transposase InsO family protein
MIPVPLQETVLEYYHEHATAVHISRDRLWGFLKTRFYWPSMYTQIKAHIKSCLICAQTKTRAPIQHGLLQPIPVQRPFELVGIDIVIMRLSTGGFKYILVAIDYFTNWVEAAPMKTLTAEETIRVFFQIIISRHGCPERLLSDSGTQFTSDLMKKLCECFNITKIESSPYHQQANGKVEKFIGFLKKALTLITPRDKLEKWNELIDHCLLVYRTSVSRVLNDNPFYLLYGRDALLPQDLAFGLNFHNINRSVRHNNEVGNPQYELLQQLTKSYAELMEKRKEEQTKYKDYYDQRHIAVEFDLGDEVLVLFDAPVKGPLVPRWEGPFEVIRKLDSVTYRIQNNDKIMAIHVQRLYLFKKQKGRIEPAEYKV